MPKTTERYVQIPVRRNVGEFFTKAAKRIPGRNRVDHASLALIEYARRHQTKLGRLKIPSDLH